MELKFHLNKFRFINVIEFEVKEIMSKYIFGLLIIFFGFYFLLENIGYDIGLNEIIDDYWPVIIVVIGLKMLFNGLVNFSSGYRKNLWITGALLRGVIVTGIGIILLGNNLEWFSFGLGDVWNLFWPLLLIYFGLKIIFDTPRFKYKGEKFELNFETGYKGSKPNKRKLWVGEAVYGMGGAWQLDDIQIWHGIGECTVNLSSAIIPEREVFIELTGLIGEVTVLVPQDLAMKVNVDVGVGEVTVFNHNQSGTSRFISYASEDYDRAVRKVNLLISFKVGEVNVKRVD